MFLLEHLESLVAHMCERLQTGITLSATITSSLFQNFAQISTIQRKTNHETQVDITNMISEKRGSTECKTGLRKQVIIHCPVWQIAQFVYMRVKLYTQFSRCF